MEIELLYVTDCPNLPEARARLFAAIEQAGVHGVVVREREVTEPADAAARGMDGSPTILLDGQAIGGAGETGSLSCRIENLPSVDDLAAIITRVGHA